MLIAYLLASGLSSGALYALVALGLVLVFRATGHMNFAHGELFMLGGFVAYSIHVALGLPFIVALACAAAAGFAVGVTSDRLVYRPLMNAPGLSLILATIGLSFLIKGIGRWAWGGLGEQVPFPHLISPMPVWLAGVPIFPQQAVVFAASLALMAAFALYFRFSLAGKTMEATAENRRAAFLVGIKVEKVYTLSWGIGGMIAAVAAVLMAPLTALSPDIGFGLLLKAFAATVLGGLGSMTGAVIGGLAIGVIESLAGGLIHTSLQQVAAYIVVFLTLTLRPSGLLGASPGREA